ncbi:transposase [Paraburkholderia sp. Cpub6]|nr:transposase [Paraburkholderia sp. Cpub6]
MAGIVFVLRTGIVSNLLPQEMGYGSGTACWRRLAARQEAGVGQRIHESWSLERPIAWPRSFGRLKIRYERYAHIHEAFLSIWTPFKPLLIHFATAS